MPKLDDAAYSDIAATLRARVAAHAPEWTDNNESDPGIVLLELFAFITESLLYRQNLMPERGRSSAARLAKFAQALADDKTRAACGALERTRYFFGQVLGADEFRIEQDYFRHRLRRLNRELVGAGVVRGLGVSVQPQDSGPGQQVVVEPGFAIDPRGEEIEVCGLASASLPQTGALLYVTLYHAERLTRPQPALNGTEFGRIKDGFAVRLEAAPADDAVALARLVGAHGRWRVDESFQPTRVGAVAT
jgi:hypothetical protein